MNAENDTIAKAIDRAAKLLRLAQSDNPNEAALAASRAQEIIDRFKLNADDIKLDGSQTVESNEPIVDFGNDPISRDKNLQRWKGRLAVIISSINQCVAYHTRGDLKLIGRPSDVAVARYMFTWIVAEVDRLANKHCVGYGRTYWNNFRTGAVEVIGRRLRDQQQSTIQTCKAEAARISNHALIVVEKNALAITRRHEEVKQFVKQKMNLRAGSSSNARYDHEAREAGRRAGATVQLGSSGNLGGGRRLNLN